MKITVDYILEKYKHRTFYLYHILGKKWGCTLDIERRLRKQGFTPNDCVEIKEVIGVRVADRLEKFLNEREGYPYNHTQSYIKNLLNRAIGLSKMDYSKRDNSYLGKWNKGRVVSNRTKKKLSLVIRKAFAEGTIDRNKYGKKGQDNNNSKLTENDVRIIREKHFKLINQNCKVPKGKLTSKQLSEKFNVTTVTILRIVNRNMWKHI
jgi:hypothetical protein